MKKVVSIMVALVVILLVGCAVADAWTVYMDDYAIACYPTGGAAYTYDGELLCAWHIDNLATYTSMDYVGDGWLDAIDEPLVAINAPGTLCTMRYYSMDSAPSGAWYVPQNIMDAIGFQPAN